MIISISGKPGSGKSTLAKMLAQELGYKRYYMGGLRRAMAKKKGMTLQELNALGEKEAWTDTEVDEYIKKLGKSEDNFIIESRTAFRFIPHSLKIFIDVDLPVGAARVFQDLQKKDNTRNEDRNLNTIDDVLKSHEKRILSDTTRYKKYYSIDAYDTSNYDFVLDTSNLGIGESFQKLYEFIRSKLDNA